MTGARLRASLVLACAATVAACGADARPVAVPPTASPTGATGATGATDSTAIVGSAPSDVATTTAPVAVGVPTPPPPASRLPATTVTTAPRVRAVGSSGWAPFARVGGITLTHPAARVERVGFHESNHDGARQLEPLPTAVAAATLESRERETGARTAADVVVDPAEEIRSPVTGRVKRAGGYVLYCKYSDDFVVIEPDAQPGWEVKIIHIDGERVDVGDRVAAGQSVLAGRATPLPFESQVDELRTAEPAWPHVHIEVVDPSIRDRPSPGGGCS